MNEIATHIVIVRGNDMVGFTSMKGCVEVRADWKHWPCLFPSHGPGRKHERPIHLVAWQQAVVSAHPKPLLRGLIHSDGNRHINRARMTERDISVARREDVAFIDSFVGPKR